MLHSLLKVKNVGPNFLRAQNPRRYIYCYSNLVYSTSRFDNCAAAALRRKKLWDLTQSRLLNSTPWAYRNLKIIFIAPKYGSNSSKIHLRSTRSLFRSEVSRTIEHILKLNFPQHVYSSLQAPKSLSLEANSSKTILIKSETKLLMSGHCLTAQNFRRDRKQHGSTSQIQQNRLRRTIEEPTSF